MELFLCGDADDKDPVSNIFFFFENGGLGIKLISLRICSSITIDLNIFMYFAGDSYGSLKYLHRIGKSALSEIIPETCEAIITVLKGRGYLNVIHILDTWIQGFKVCFLMLWVIIAYRRSKTNLSKDIYMQYLQAWEIILIKVN